MAFACALIALRLVFGLWTVPLGVLLLLVLCNVLVLFQIADHCFDGQI